MNEGASFYRVLIGEEKLSNEKCELKYERVPGPTMLSADAALRTLVKIQQSNYHNLPYERTK